MAQYKGKGIDYCDGAIYIDVGQVKGTRGRQSSALGWGWQESAGILGLKALGKRVVLDSARAVAIGGAAL